MSKELVKYHNDLNSLSMSNWTTEEMNLFFSILVKARDKGTEEIVLNCEELKTLTGTNTRNSYWYSMVDNFCEKIMSIIFKDINGSEKTFLHVFRKITLNTERKDLSIIVDEEFKYIINKLNSRFTVYELDEFTSINSTYLKTLYRLIKQWRTVGQLKIGIDDFKNLLEIPKSYNVGKIKKRIIDLAEKELPKYIPGFKVQVNQSMNKGYPVTGYTFTWDKEKPIIDINQYNAFKEKKISNKQKSKPQNNKNFERNESIADLARQRRLERIKNEPGTMSDLDNLLNRVFDEN